MKKILFIVHRIPYPPNKGDKIRTFNELKYLSKNNLVDVVCLADQKDDLQYVNELQKYCRNLQCFSLCGLCAKVRGLLALFGGRSLTSRYFYLGKMQSAIDHALMTDNYDAVLCFSSSMAEYLFHSRTLKHLSTPPKTVMDFCDIDSDKWGQYAEDSRFPLSNLYRLEQQLLRHYECRIQKAFDGTVLISAGEAEHFKQYCHDLSLLKIISNGVDLNFFKPGAGYSVLSKPHPVIVFTGAMDYNVNIQGVLWFVRNVWPDLRQKHPDLELYIVGSNPVAEIGNLSGLPGVTVTGFVEDIRSYYELADICIAPLHMGRGVQNKVLEAMAMSKAIVSTSRANAGIQGQPDQHLLIADNIEEFGNAISDLLSNPEKRSLLAQNARQFVVENYDWDTNMSELERLLLSEFAETSGEEMS